jgi:hypothetical protein
VGAVAGLVIFVIAFLVSYRLNPPTSFIRTTLKPSRVFWNLPPADFDSPYKVLKMIVQSVQWGQAAFSEENLPFRDMMQTFTDRFTGLEFSPMVFLIARLGVVVMVLTQPMRGFFPPLAFLVSLYFILNYQVEDQHVFFLSLYIPLAIAIGTGLGFLLEVIQYFMQSVPHRQYLFLSIFPVLFFTTVVIQPTAAVRWRALRAGVANFVTDTYQFPVENLQEPRFVAQMQLAGVEPNTVFVLDWRELYATAYVAHVEQYLTNTLFLEAMPHGDNGMVASTLIDELKGYLQEGRPVFADQIYPGLDKDFRLLPVAGNLYKLSLKKEAPTN